MDSNLALWFTALSVLSLVAAVVVLPYLLAELPADFLVSDAPWRPEGHPARTALGAALIVVGVAMLVLPGQGILTIIAGLALTQFPGKDRAMRRLLRPEPVVRAVNAMRRRIGAPPLESPQRPD